MQQEFVFSAVN